MAKKIKWSTRARREQFAILEYWANRNKSKTYSLKLSREFLDYINLLPNEPLLGKAASRDNVRFIIVREYLIFYLIMDDYIEIITIWDSRRDPNKLKL
ncbi:type II toxin-antitoxin system RelE/ParE family toxin [Mucilaginibacter ximonensis]|uniref:Type II toxin-antitoxin system RelE/ParE family toxin n=1 Tax=Mucilaginibacter ximonensis TaxID=538021 RepID=A0ABW5YCD8_9SPHI